jgi:hypothetical protein
MGAWVAPIARYRGRIAACRTRAHRPAPPRPRARSVRCRRPRAWAAWLLAWLVAAANLSTQAGPLAARPFQPAAPRQCPDPAGEDADPGEGSIPEEPRESSEASDALIVRRLSLPSYPSPASEPRSSGTSAFASDSTRRMELPGHFLASGRALRRWIQSLHC